MAKSQADRYELIWDDVRGPEALPGLTPSRAPVSAREEPSLARGALIAGALAFLLLFLFVPLAAVFTEALRKGWHAYIAAILEPDAWSAVKLTLLAAAIAVPLNVVFGVAAAWAIAKFEFRARAC